MRLIGKFDDEGPARTFSKQLSRLKIDNQIAVEPDGTYEIWVIGEDEVKRAEKLLTQFQSSPDKTESRAIPKPTRKAPGQKRDDGQKKKTTPPPGPFPANVTLFLIIFSVIVGIFSGLGKNTSYLQKFFITDIISDGGYIQWHKGLPEVFGGEFWRLVTPIFIHFGFAHLFFNMLWLYNLGKMTEEEKGSWVLGIFTVVVATAGNLAQFLLSSPYFGGMSGVLYGLLGYCLMKVKYEPGTKIFLRRITLYTMMMWYFLSLTGLLGRMANTAHTVGLIIGLTWGYLGSKKRNQLKT